MACQGLKAVGVVLHRGCERQAAEGRQSAPADRRPEPEKTELPEALPWWHAALVLLEGVVPGLRRASEMIGREPGTIRSERPLPSKELLALVEPVEGVLGVVVGGEVDLGEPRRCLGRSAVSSWLRGAEQRGRWRLVGVLRVGTRGAGWPAELRERCRLFWSRGVDR